MTATDCRRIAPIYFQLAVWLCFAPAGGWAQDIGVWAKQLPAAAFENAIEEIDDLETLLNSDRTKAWTVQIKNADFLQIRSNTFTNNILKIFTLKPKSTPIICVNTLNAQVSNLECWRKSKNNPGLKKAPILPKIHVNEFLTRKDRLSKKYDLYAYYFLNEQNIIQASVNTWMNPDFEKRELYWDILLKWDGHSFKIVKTKRR